MSDTRKVLKLPTGYHVADTPAMRKRFPDAVPEELTKLNPRHERLEKEAKKKKVAKKKVSKKKVVAKKEEVVEESDDMDDAFDSLLDDDNE